MIPDNYLEDMQDLDSARDVPGAVDVLHTSRGHLTLNFNSDDPIEVEKARTAVTRMLRDGYWLFITVNGKTQRVLDFDPTCDEYIIAQVIEVDHATQNLKADQPVQSSVGSSFTEEADQPGRGDSDDSAGGAHTDADATADGATVSQAEAGSQPAAPRKGKGKGKSRVSAKTTSVTSAAPRSAG